MPILRINKAQSCWQKNFIDFILLIQFCFFLLAFPHLSFANVSNNKVKGKSTQNKDFIKLYEQDLLLLENYLNSIGNLTANFTQKSVSGNVTGRFFFKKDINSASKISIQYKGESKIKIIVNGNVLAYQDLSLKEVSYFNINETPASFFAEKKISFANSQFKILDIKKQKITEDNLLKGVKIIITIAKNDDPEFSSFELLFFIEAKDNIEGNIEGNIELQGINAKNHNNDITQFSLSNIDKLTPISNKIFTIPKKLTTE
jgi:outer membrane lipoprotein-sorting protein